MNASAHSHAHSRRVACNEIFLTNVIAILKGMGYTLEETANITTNHATHQNSMVFMTDMVFPMFLDIQRCAKFIHRHMTHTNINNDMRIMQLTSSEFVHLEEHDILSTRITWYTTHAIPCNFSCQCMTTDELDADREQARLLAQGDFRVW